MCNPQLHELLVTLVTQLFEAEAQANKADKKEAQATAALLATVQAQRENAILEASTKATIDALVGEGFNAPRTLRDHVKRWADMISAGPSRCGSLSTANRTARRFSHGCTRATSAKGAARSLTIASSWMTMATPPSRRTRHARTWRSAAQSRRTSCYFPPPPSSSRSLAAT